MANETEQKSYLDYSGLSLYDTLIKQYVDDSMVGVVSLTYSDLKTLRNSSGLTVGAQYRITDYQCTTKQANTTAATHQFDIIVVADNECTLNENATVVKHDGDTYFKNCNLEAWEIKYCLDNSTYRFAWADTANGKGVIYYMKDEWGNEAPYDFKNIMYTSFAYVDRGKLTGDNVNNFSETGNTICSTASTTTFRYTFNRVPDYRIEKASDGTITGRYVYKYKNCRIKGTALNISRIPRLPFVMFNTTNSAEDVLVDGNCSDITIETLTDSAANVSTSQGALGSIYIYNVNNLYVLCGQFYSNEIKYMRDSCIVSWGSNATSIWHNTFMGIANCLCLKSHIKVLNFGFRSTAIKLYGASAQYSNFEGQSSNIRWICDDGKNGYFLSNTFLLSACNIVFNSPWIYNSVFYSGDHFVEIETTGTTSFNVPITNIELHGSNYGTSTDYKTLNVPSQNSGTGVTSYVIYKNNSKTIVV